MNSTDLRLEPLARTLALAVLVAFAVSCGNEGITINTPECTPVDLTYPGSATGTINAGTCQSGGFHAALYRFTVDQDSAHQFAVTSGFPVIGVEVMSDPPGVNAVWTGVNNSVNAVWLMPPGTYLLRITARNGLGDYALTGSHAPLNTTQCTIRTLVVGVTLQDQLLAATDCPWLDGQGNPDGTYFDAYRIASNQPCTISMESATMDSFIEIRDITQGTVLGGDDDSGGGNDALVSLNACNYNGAPIVIRANTATSAVPTGAYTLTVVLGGGGPVVAPNRSDKAR